MGQVGEVMLQSLEGHCQGFGFYSKGDRYDEVSYGGPLVCAALSCAYSQDYKGLGCCFQVVYIPLGKQNKTKLTASMIESDRADSDLREVTFLGGDIFAYYLKELATGERRSMPGRRNIYREGPEARTSLCG